MSESYEVSIGITTHMSVNATGWIAQNSDSLGARSIWIGEDIALGQEIFVLTAATLLQSKKVRVGTGIIPVTVHNIATLARAGVTLDEIGAGRFAFGLGIGGIQDLEKYGIHIKRPVTELRKSVKTLRRLWAGETLDSSSEKFSLHDFNLGQPSPINIPIFLGVRGPKMLKLTGKVADGVILSGPFDYLRYAIKLVDDAAEEAGRSKNDVEKVVWVPTIPTFKGIQEKVARRVVALVIADTPDAVLDMLTVDREKVNQIRETVAASSPKEGAEFVDDELLDVFSISGTKEHMVDRFEEVASIGATEVVIGPPFSGDWRKALVEIFAEVDSRRVAP
ncbi:MAG: LLM class flavin-dependent oxidoreductase [Candidatus Thorarchaeota archaeon]|nr:LLM class flavin-dependent oxidoreductase [Candidatus Thorarchaeota archaeon]